jgi:GTPase SAR1 family protein
MKSNSEILSSNKMEKLTHFLKGVRYFKFNLINGTLKEYINEIDGKDITTESMEHILSLFIGKFGIDWLLEKLSLDIYELFEKTISVGQVIAILHKIIGIKLSSTERSQLHELRKKIRRYDKFLKHFGEWGKKFDSVFKILIFGLNDQDSNNLEYFMDKAKISAGKQNIGVEFYTKDIEIFKKSIVRLQVWEIATNISFKTIRPQYYKGAAAAIIFFYTDDKNSFELIKTYIAELKAKTKLKFTPRKQADMAIDMPLALVGLGSSNKEMHEAANSISKEINARFFDFNEINYETIEEIIKYITSLLTFSF